MGLRPNLPPLIMETSYEVSSRARGDADFTGRYLDDLRENGLGSYYGMVVTGANEIAGDNPALAEAVRRFGCQLLSAVDCAATLQDVQELFGSEPLETA